MTAEGRAERTRRAVADAPRRLRRSRFLRAEEMLGDRHAPREPILHRRHSDVRVKRSKNAERDKPACLASSSTVHGPRRIGMHLSYRLRKPRIAEAAQQACGASPILWRAQRPHQQHLDQARQHEVAPGSLLACLLGEEPSERRNRSIAADMDHARQERNEQRRLGRVENKIASAAGGRWLDHPGHRGAFRPRTSASPWDRSLWLAEIEARQREAGRRRQQDEVALFEGQRLLPVDGQDGTRPSITAQKPGGRNPRS